MASLPEEAFCKTVTCRIQKAIKKHINPKIYRYGIFSVICIEILSILLKQFDLYSVKTYCILTQIVCALLIYNNNYSLKPKKLCIRKKWAYNTLFSYYIVGAVSLIAGVSYNFYSDIINYVLLFVSFILILLSFKDE